MDNRTRTALEQSIAKWEANAKAENLTYVSLGADSCPLCVIFNTGLECGGCPVFERTESPHCNETPYVAAFTAYTSWAWGENNGQRFRAAARHEVEFLKSLLPEA